MSGLALLLALLGQDWAGLPASRPCGETETAALLAPGGPDNPPVRLACRARLGPGDVVTRRILFEGAEASGAGLDCGGGSVGRPGQGSSSAAPTIAVWSRRDASAGGEPAWSRPTDIALANCTVHGSIRIWGMGAGRAHDDLRASSRQPDHTAVAQSAAPSHIALSGMVVIGTGSIPLYIGPGVTRVAVTGSRFAGRSDGTAVYLDAESADNELRNNTFAVRTGREQIAVDGSARNRITGNRFVLGRRGGVYLYRNCGERGVIRHQTPSFNVITGNEFAGASWLRPRTVVVGAREGRRSYCTDDAGLPFGSSADDGDNAEGNVVARNRTRR